ncbi:ABC transporter ATP-binding protein [Caldicellulosiruptoraceae bacterium PP1]
MIKVENLTKRFDDIEALDNVSIHIQKASIFGIVGTNGAGKTTLLKSIVGVYKTDRGKITIDGEDVFENVKVKSRIFYIPDNPFFFSQFNIKQMSEFYKGVFSSWNQERFDNLNKIFNLDIKKKISKFSKGMQKQAAIYLGLSTMPDILIMDEPFDGLDPVIRKRFKSLIINDVAERDMTVVISSHNLRELEDFCDHISILHKGEVILEKDIDDLKHDINKIQVVFKEDFDINCLNEFSILSFESRGSIKDIVIKGNKEKIVEILNRYQPVILDILPLTLEEIFIYEMGEVGYEVQNIVN